MPRWHSSKVAARSGELAGVNAVHSEMDRSGSALATTLQEWRQNGGLFVASELISDALLDDVRSDEIIAAADFVLTSPQAGPFAKEIARAVLGSSDHEPAVFTTGLDIGTLRGSIRNLRRRVSADPRNAIAWTDMALAYTTLGQVKAAEEALRRALILASDNRLVVRSAVRFWVHRRDPRRALDILRRAPSLRSDPWLIAAEIAVSQLLDERSSLIRTAQRALDSGAYSDYHLSELTGAVASVMLGDGGLRNSRKLFNRSLVDPTDNSVAQATWASFESGIDLPVGKHLSDHSTFEARARTAAHVGDWQTSVTESSLWVADQPFSASAAGFASYAASVGLHDYATGAELARLGLSANPDSVLLSNNLAFCLASIDEVDAAGRVLARLPKSEIESDGVLIATTGLIEFRRGNPEVGRALYRRALQFFDRQDLPKSRAMAAIYLAREERRARTEFAREASGEAERLAARRLEPDVQVALEEMRVVSLVGP